LMLVLTLASQPWAHPERTPLLALFVALAALLWSGANTFFTYFWHFSDFRVYLDFTKPEQVRANTLDVNYFFQNMGNQTISLEDVEIDDLWIKSADPNVLGGELSRCNDHALMLPTWATLSQFSSSVIWEEHKPIFRKSDEPIEGVLVAVVKPTKIYIDGSEAKSAAVIVEAGKMKVITAIFETTPLPIANYETAVVCPVIRLFNNDGRPVTAICKGSQLSHVSPAVPFMPRGMVGEAAVTQRLSRLLPVSSNDNCQIEIYPPSARQLTLGASAAAGVRASGAKPPGLSSRGRPRADSPATRE
jgi:hypothetical protein